MTALVNDLAALPADVALVLADYHDVHARAIHDSLTLLIRHAPPRFHLVLATRADPPLPLARLRVQ